MYISWSCVSNWNKYLLYIIYIHQCVVNSRSDIPLWRGARTISFSVMLPEAVVWWSEGELIFQRCPTGPPWVHIPRQNPCFQSMMSLLVNYNVWYAFVAEDRKIKNNNLTETNVEEVRTGYTAWPFLVYEVSYLRMWGRWENNNMEPTPDSKVVSYNYVIPFGV